VQRCAIGLIGLGPAPVRATSAEAKVGGTALADLAPGQVGRIAMEGLDSVPSDLHGSADYRRRVGATMVERAWTAAVAEARRA
jgi:aerobic carbon-monoxide dehydrogenase medium subunit